MAEPDASSQLPPDAPASSTARANADDLAAQITVALEARDFARASGLFAPDAARLTTRLSAAHLFTLGAALARQRETQLAIATLRRIAYGDTPVAARALFLLGRLYGDVLGDAETGGRYLRRLVRCFPDSPEAASVDASAIR